MSIRHPGRPTLPLPPQQYDASYMSRLVKSIQVAFSIIENVQQLRGSGDPTTNAKDPSPLNLANIPTSSAGLKSGDVWSDGGTLKIV